MKWLLTRLLLIVTLINLNFYPVLNSYPRNSSITVSSLTQIIGGLSVTKAFTCEMDDCMTVTPPQRNEITYEHGESSYRRGPGSSYGRGGSGHSSETSDSLKLEDYETVNDGLTVLVQLKNELNKLLGRIDVNLTSEARDVIKQEVAKLDRAISRGNLLLGAINSGSQTAIHAAKGDYLLAAGEVAALVAAVVAGVVASGPITTVVVSFGVGYLAEKAIDEYAIPWIKNNFNINNFFVPDVRAPIDIWQWQCNLRSYPNHQCEELR